MHLKNMYHHNLFQSSMTLIISSSSLPAPSSLRLRFLSAFLSLSALSSYSCIFEAHPHPPARDPNPPFEEWIYNSVPKPLPAWTLLVNLCESAHKHSSLSSRFCHLSKRLDHPSLDSGSVSLCKLSPNQAIPKSFLSAHRNSTINYNLSQQYLAVLQAY